MESIRRCLLETFLAIVITPYVLLHRPRRASASTPSKRGTCLPPTRSPQGSGAGGGILGPLLGEDAIDLWGLCLQNVGVVEMAKKVGDKRVVRWNDRTLRSNDM